MNERGFFDLPAPLFDAIDRTLALALPDVARVLVYAVIAAWLSMWLYARVSPQRRLHAVRRALRRSQRRMLDDDIEFSELMRRSRHSLCLGGRQVWMILGPSLLVALPLLFLLCWMSNRFDARLPPTGTAISVCTTPSTAIIDVVPAQNAADAQGCRSVMWPSPKQPIVLSDTRHTLLQLPFT